MLISCSFHLEILKNDFGSDWLGKIVIFLMLKLGFGIDGYFGVYWMDDNFLWLEDDYLWLELVDLGFLEVLA